MAVVFNEPTSTRRAVVSKTSGITGMIIKMGLAKTPAGAQLVMIIIAVLALIGVFMLFPWLTKAPPAPPVTTGQTI